MNLLPDPFRYISSSRLHTIYWILTIFLSAIGIGVMYCTLFGNGTLSLIVIIISALTDSLVLFLPLIFLKKKFKWIVPFWFMFLSLLELSNIIYFRNFHDCISGISYLSSGSINKFVIKSAAASIRWVDALFIVNPLIIFAITFVTPTIQKTSRKFQILYIALSFILLSSQIALSIRRIRIYKQLNDTENILTEYYKGFNQQTCWKYYVLHYGFTGYLIRVIKDFAGANYILSDAEKRRLDELWHQRSQPTPICIEKNDSIFNLNREKNLIFIVVESLNSKIFSLPDSHIIAPNLNALIKDTTTLSYLNVMPQTRHGRSSDGQFIYNTGMLPLRDEALITRYADANYPSLAKIINRHSAIEVIGEDRSLWNHSITSLSYGYTDLIDNVTPPNTPISQQDSLIFSRAAGEISKIVSPFFIFITTIGMHEPYNQDTGMVLSLSAKYDQRDLHYLESVHAFDKSLGQFIEFLKKSGVYHNSVIVIAADHEESPPQLSSLFSEKKIPVIILNSGFSAPHADITPQYQVNVFPSILDIMGVSTKGGYRGVGRSMLRNDSSISSEEMEEIWDISELSIRGKYFPFSQL